jgi:arylsulfatase A-like enzyme
MQTTVMFRKQLASLFLASLVLAPIYAEAPQRPPNLIFVLADDLGYGDVGCYGQKLIHTPNLDRLAADGMRFTQFYAGSTVCAPSRCCLMTGYHTGHGWIRSNARMNLRPTDVTVAKILKERGYATGLFGKWGLGIDGGTGVPTRQGFDEFYGYLDQVHAHNYYPSFLMRGEKRESLQNEVPPVKDTHPFGTGVATRKVQYSHDVITTEAFSFIERNKDQPFFLYLAWTIPHANNEAKATTGNGCEVPDQGIYKDETWPAAQKGYAAMISYMDRDVGRLRELLRKNGLEQNTLIIFSSDNGPHKEGGNDPDFTKSAGPLRGIKRDLYEGGIRVPTIACWPGHVKPGVVSDHVGAFWDVLPTFADLAGATDKIPQGIDGISFAPTLLGNGSQPQHDDLYWVFYERGGARALRMGNWKAVQQPIKGPIELYDLSKDVGEKNNVAAKHSDIVETMRKRMDAAFATNEQWKLPK